MIWYYSDGTQRFGPFTQEQFDALVVQGRIAPATLVWREGMANWLSYAQMVDPSGAPLQTCSQCQRPLAGTDMLNYQGLWVCADCKETFFQRLREGLSLNQLSPGTFRYGGFWIRFLAFIIDYIILNTVGFIMGVAFGSLYTRHGLPAEAGVILYILSVGVALSYHMLFVGRFGATPGKMACGLKIVRPDGERVTYLRAMARYFACVLSGLILCIGYIIAAFDPQKRALHDSICATRVIHSR